MANQSVKFDQIYRAELTKQYIPGGMASAIPYGGQLYSKARYFSYRCFHLLG